MRSEQLVAILYCGTWLALSWRMYRELNQGNGFNIVILLGSFFSASIFAILFWAVIAGLTFLVAVAFGWMP